MSHKYYSDDTDQRKSYFEGKFLSKVGGIAFEINNFESFKAALKEAWSDDPSLLSYYEGMDDEELEEFFNRSAVQNIIKKTPEQIATLIERQPKEVKQIKKRTIRYYDGEIKGRRVLVRKFFQLNRKTGKRKAVYRDSKGRYAKRIK